MGSVERGISTLDTVLRDTVHSYSYLFALPEASVTGAFLPSRLRRYALMRCNCRSTRDTNQFQVAPGRPLVSRKCGQFLLAGV